MPAQQSVCWRDTSKSIDLKVKSISWIELLSWVVAPAEFREQRRQLAGWKQRKQEHEQIYGDLWIKENICLHKRLRLYVQALIIYRSFMSDKEAFSVKMNPKRGSHHTLVKCLLCSSFLQFSPQCRFSQFDSKSIEGFQKHIWIWYFASFYVHIKFWCFQGIRAGCVMTFLWRNQLTTEKASTHNPFDERFFPNNRRERWPKVK